MASSNPADEFEDIAYEVRQATAEIVLDRPDCLNAIRPQTLSELNSAIDQAETDPEVVAGLIRSGSDQFFSSGGDLNVVGELIGDQSGYESFLESWHETFNKLNNSDIPIVGYVTGPALAGGLELVLVCDVAVASADAEFGDQHINLNLLPSGGGSQRLPHLVGLRRAKELILTGKTISAKTAEDWGLVNHVIEKDDTEADPLETARSFVKTISQHDPDALCRSKELINRSVDLDLEDGIELELQAVLRHQHSDAAKTGLAEFFEK